jgi:hypothetical protein
MDNSEEKISLEEANNFRPFRYKRHTLYRT